LFGILPGRAAAKKPEEPRKPKKIKRFSRLAGSARRGRIGLARSVFYPAATSNHLRELRKPP
jgi:hypothetical protein